MVVEHFEKYVDSGVPCNEAAIVNRISQIKKVYNINNGYKINNIDVSINSDKRTVTITVSLTKYRKESRGGR